MADSGIKKYSIKNADLPDIYVPEEAHLVRYRIVSEDKNRVSHWSPIFAIKPEYTFVPGSIVLSKQSDHVNAIWDTVVVNKVVGSSTYFIKNAKEYDVWIRWGKGSNNGDWIYKERVEGTTASFVIPNSFTNNGVVINEKPNEFSIEIYLIGTPVERGDGIPLASGTPFLKVYRILESTV